MIMISNLYKISSSNAYYVVWIFAFNFHNESTANLLSSNYYLIGLLSIACGAGLNLFLFSLLKDLKISPAVIILWLMFPNGILSWIALKDTYFISVSCLYFLDIMLKGAGIKSRTMQSLIAEIFIILSFVVIGTKYNSIAFIPFCYIVSIVLNYPMLIKKLDNSEKTVKWNLIYFYLASLCPVLSLYLSQSLLSNYISKSAFVLSLYTVSVVTQFMSASVREKILKRGSYAIINNTGLMKSIGILNLFVFGVIAITPYDFSVLLLCITLSSVLINLLYYPSIVTSGAGGFALIFNSLHGAVFLLITALTPLHQISSPLFPLGLAHSILLFLLIWRGSK